MSLLTVDGLVKHFSVRGADRPLVAVSDVSFTIDRGETLALVGESGSGKTTVGRILVGLETATSGTVAFDGRDLASMSPRERRALSGEIQMVFQDPLDSLDPRWRIAGLVGEPLVAAGVGREERRGRVEAAMDHVRLDRAVLDAYPHELSAGANQKVALARALVSGPRLVVLDEPTSALDVRARIELLDVLAGLREETGLATLFISHDLLAVRGIADRVSIMYLGEVIETGPTPAVFGDPRHPYSRALLSAVPQPDPALAGAPTLRLTGEIPSPIDLPAGCYLRGRCPRAVEACASLHPDLLATADDHLVACLLEQQDSRFYDPDDAWSPFGTRPDAAEDAASVPQSTR